MLPGCTAGARGCFCLAPLLASCCLVHRALNARRVARLTSGQSGRRRSALCLITCLPCSPAGPHSGHAFLPVPALRRLLFALWRSQHHHPPTRPSPRPRAWHCRDQKITGYTCSQSLVSSGTAGNFGRRGTWAGWLGWLAELHPQLWPCAAAAPAAACGHHTPAPGLATAALQVVKIDGVNNINLAAVIDAAVSSGGNDLQASQLATGLPGGQAALPVLGAGSRP